MRPATSTAGTRRRLRVPAPGRRGRTVLVALVAALVVGILGMHALASHSAPSPAGAADAAVPSRSMSVAGAASGHDAAMAAGTSHVGHAHPEAAPHASAGAAGTSADPGSDSRHDMASMVMLCAVMLATAALTLLVVLAAGIVRPLLPAAFQPAAVRERALEWVRGTGPPPEWQFSVIRC